MMSRMPRTPAEWQKAIGTAQILLLIDSSNRYGLTTCGGMKINVDRCLYILEEGRNIGHRPSPNKELLKRLCGEAHGA